MALAAVAALLLFMASPVPSGREALAAPVSSGEPRITGVKVETSSPLRVSFAVADAFNSDIEEAIKSGIPTSFTYLVDLGRPSLLWFDEGLGSWEFRHTVKYDTLREEYTVVMDEVGRQGVKTKDFDEMKRLMTTVGDVEFMPSRPLVTGEKYRLRVKAELKTTRFPFLLDYMFFFVKLWDFETDWHSHDFDIR